MKRLMISAENGPSIAHRGVAWTALLQVIGAASVATVANAHPGGLDGNGGHLDRSTGAYHCHAAGCVLPTILAPASTQTGISVASFNIQFLGSSTKRDDDALAEAVENNDIVVVQELVAPPFPGVFPDGAPFKPDPEAAEFFDSMVTRGFEFVLSQEDTGTGDQIHLNSSATEWWVTFYKPGVVQPTTDVPSGFLADDRSNHDDYERVPFAIGFRSTTTNFDFVLISVHLQPSPGPANAARRAHELASIAEWIGNNDETEGDFIILGDMNIENCTELAQATPSGFSSLNNMCKATNTNVNGPKPYDHVMFRTNTTTNAELSPTFEVIDLVALMEPSWLVRHTGPYPGDPYHHNPFRAVYTDHNPVVFRLIASSDDD